MIFLVLFSALDWTTEIAVIETEVSTAASADYSYMIFNNYDLYPTLFYHGAMVAVRKDGVWKEKRLLSRKKYVETVAYDSQNRLALVCYENFGEHPDDSIYLLYYPDANDSVNYVKLDSCSKFEGSFSYRGMSKLRFLNDKPVFVYNRSLVHYPEKYYVTNFLKYAWEDNKGNWHVDIIDSSTSYATDTEYNFVYPRLVVGTNNIPYLIYTYVIKPPGSVQNMTSDLCLARKLGDKWVFEVIDTSNDAKSYSINSFAVDKKGYVHLFQSYNYMMYYTTNVSGKWVNDTVGVIYNPYASLLPCCLGLLPDESPVGFTTSINDGIEPSSRYYWRGAKGWHEEKCHYSVDFAIDQWGNMHLMGFDTSVFRVPDTIFHLWMNTGLEENFVENTVIELSTETIGQGLRVYYSIPNGEHGVLSLYDASGKRIGQKDVNGTSSVNFNAGYSSGVYFVQLKSRLGKVSKKAVVIR